MNPLPGTARAALLAAPIVASFQVTAAPVPRYTHIFVIVATPYNHYSLLRTTEAAFGIDEYLGHAADESRGVVTMSALFAVP